MKQLMKQLMIAVVLAVACTATQAQDLLQMGNEAGGRIFLTDEVCKFGGKTYNALLRAHSFVRSGHVIEGCYYLDGDTNTIHARWFLAEVEKRVYNLADFTIIKRSSKGGI